jgi:hypothetical protein
MYSKCLDFIFFLSFGWIWGGEWGGGFFSLWGATQAQHGMTLRITNSIILKSNLVWGPSLTLQPLFHPQFECSSKESETRYCVIKLGMSSQDLQDLF